MPIVELPFPLKGYNKNWAYGKQPPITSPYMINMRPYDPDEVRARGGASPTEFFTSNNSRWELFGVTYTGADMAIGVGAAATVICGWRGRLVGAGPTGDGADFNAGLLGTFNTKWNQYNWAMSRAGDPTDFTYLANDAGTPVSGSIGESGRVVEKIIALAPHTDDYLIAGCENSIWLFRGDPAWGGSIDKIVEGIGILGLNAWCFDYNGNFYFASKSGLYKMPAGFSGIQNLSADKVPDIFSGSGNSINLAFDPINMGICITTSISDYPAWSTSASYYPGANVKYNSVCYTSLTFQDSSAASPNVNSNWQTTTCPASNSNLFDYWWYDFRTEGFFPEDHDGTPATPTVFYAPFQMGSQNNRRGKLTELIVTTGSSDNIDVSVWVANSEIELMTKYNTVVAPFKDDADVNSGEEAVFRPNVSGAFLGVELENPGIVIEKVVANIEPIGLMDININGQKVSQIDGLIGKSTTTYGPFPMGKGTDNYGLLKTISVTKDSNSTPTCYVYAGNSEMEVRANLETGTGAAKWNSGALSLGAARKNLLRPRIRGVYAAVQFSGDDIDQVTVEIESTGKVRI